MTYINTDELWPGKSGLVDGLSGAGQTQLTVGSSLLCHVWWLATGAWGWARVGNDISPYLVLWLHYGYTKRKFVSSLTSLNSSPDNSQVSADYNPPRHNMPGWHHNKPPQPSQASALTFPSTRLAIRVTKGYFYLFTIEHSELATEERPHDLRSPGGKSACFQLWLLTIWRVLCCLLVFLKCWNKYKYTL